MTRSAVIARPGARRRKKPVAAAKPRTKELAAIVSDSRMFEFHSPLRVTGREEGGIWIHECKPLRILAYAESREESWQAFLDYFESDWDGIAQEKDSRLTLDATEMKREYHKLVKSVRPAP